MRSVSDDGEDMHNSPERGPLGPGGVADAEAPHIVAGTLMAEGFRRPEPIVWEGAMSGPDLSCRPIWEDSGLN